MLSDGTVGLLRRTVKNKVPEEQSSRLETYIYKHQRPNGHFIQNFIIKMLKKKTPEFQKDEICVLWNQQCWTLAV